MSNLSLTQAGRGYYRKVLSTESPHLIGYWPLWEMKGSVAQNLVTSVRNGTYTVISGYDSTGIVDGNGAPTFDGSNDVTNIYTAALASVFNGNEGSVMIWAKVANVGVWTDGTQRILIRFLADGNNGIDTYMNAGDANIYLIYAAGGTVEVVASGGSSIAWMCFAITWSSSADEVKFYKDGVQTGSTSTGLGTFAGSLANSITNIGAGTTVPANVWDGYLAHAAVWTTPLSDSQILALATI